MLLIGWKVKLPDFGGKQQWRAGLLLCRFLILFTSSGKSSATGTPSVTVVAVD